LESGELLAKQEGSCIGCDTKQTTANKGQTVWR